MPAEVDEVDDDDTDYDTPAMTQLRRQVKNLEKKLAASAEAEQRAAAAEKRAAFAEAGIPTEGQAVYFRKGYDGEMTADAIKAAAIEAGFLQAPSATNAAEDAHDRVSDASAGAPGVTREADYEAAMYHAAANGGTDEILAVMRQYGKPIADTID